MEQQINFQRRYAEGQKHMWKQFWNSNEMIIWSYERHHLWTYMALYQKIVSGGRRNWQFVELRNKFFCRAKCRLGKVLVLLRDLRAEGGEILYCATERKTPASQSISFSPQRYKPDSRPKDYLLRAGALWIHQNMFICKRVSNSHVCCLRMACSFR